MAIRLVIDSASDIPLQDAAAMGIDVISMQVTFGGETFTDRVDLTPDRFYEKLVETDELPVTSQIPPHKYEERFKEIIDAGDTPFAITLSSKLSGTYQSACIAAGSFGGKVYVVDSLNVSLGEAVLIRYAAERVRAGIEPEELERELLEKREKICVLALLDTLEYLKKGGRISSAVAFAGGILAIKPVVSVERGEVKMAGKARGSKHGGNLLLELVRKSGGIDFSMPYTLAYSGVSDHLLKKYVEDSRSLWQDKTRELPVMRIGATIGTHVGPGAIGVAFFSN